MALKKIAHESLERKANQPGAAMKEPRAHRGTRERIHKSGRVSQPHLIPTDRDRKEYDLLRPEEVQQGYQVRWSEAD